MLLQLKQILQDRAELAKTPVLDEQLESLGTGQVDVIVELSAEPVALAKGISSIAGKSFSSSMKARVEQKVELQQQTFIDNLSTNHINHEVSNQYSYAFNGVALEMDSNKLEDILKIPVCSGYIPIWK